MGPLKDSHAFILSLSLLFREVKAGEEKERDAGVNPKSMTRLGPKGFSRKEEGGKVHLSENKRQPEATDNTRFHKFFRARFIPHKFRRTAETTAMPRNLGARI